MHNYNHPNTPPQLCKTAHPSRLPPIKLLPGSKPRQTQPWPLPFYNRIQDPAGLPPGCKLLLRQDWAAPPQPGQGHPRIKTDVPLRPGPVLLELLLQSCLEADDHPYAAVRPAVASTSDHPNGLQQQQPQVGPQLLQRCWRLPGCAIIQQQDADAADINLRPSAWRKKAGWWSSDPDALAPRSCVRIRPPS
jgi:hypothetical protein